ncbi:MAG: septum formation initiator family protein [Candidatus Cloacimonadaceae bacterium]
MKVKTAPLEKKKPIRVFYWLIVIVLLALTLFFGRNSFLKMTQKKLEVAKLQSKVEQLKAENDSLRKENQDLKTDPAVIEKIAREQFGYQKSDEKVFRFLPDNGGNQTQKSKQSDAEGK